MECDVVTVLLEAIQRDSDSVSVMILALNAIGYLMEKSEDFKVAFVNQDGQKAIEELQISPYHEVYKLSQEILERHLGGEEMLEQEKKEFIGSKFLI